MMPLFARFKYVLLMLSLGLVIGAASAQSTTVSITAVDQGGQVWANGTISYVFQPNPAYGGVYFWNGSALPNQYKTPQVVSLNGSGFASFSIPTSVGFITPAGSSWKFVVCPNASAIVCTVVFIPTSGSTQNISSIVTANSPAISLNPTPMPLAYTDSELQTVPNQGGLYFNVTALLPKYFDGSIWHFFGSGGGGSPAAPNFFYQLNNGAGAFGTGALFTDSTFQQLFYSASNVPSNGALQYINSGFTCTPNALPALFPGLAQGQDICNLIQYNPTYPGWNLGNTGGGAQGVMSNTALQINTNGASEGIKTGILMFHKCNSIGDCSGIDINVDARGACGIDASCEGYGPWRAIIREGAETTGTSATTGNNLNTVTLNTTSSQDAVGLDIYIPAYDLLTTIVTSASVGTNSSYGILNTTSTTLPVSIQCNVVAVAPTVIGVLPEGVYTAASLTVSTTVDLTSAVGQLATFVSPIISTYRLLSVGAFNSGAQTQVINLNINKNILVGSKYCIGGLAGRGIEQTFYTTNGQVYLLSAIGSPTNATIWFSSQTTQGPALPISTSTGTINIYHKATIVGISGNVFSLSDNDIHWVAGNTWVSTNTVNQIRYDELSLGLWNDPYTIDQGHEWLKQGLSTQASQFVFAKNQSTPSNFTGHGGTYPAPLFAVIAGPVGAGEFWVNSPDSCFFSGNPCAPAAISMGPIAAGNTQTQWIIASNRADGDNSQFIFNPVNNSWSFTTPGQGTGDPAGPGFMATTYQFQAGAALTIPTHSIEGSGSSGVSNPASDTTAAFYIENRNGTGSSIESLLFGLSDSFNQRALVGGIAMVNVNNSHFGPSGDLHFWLNNAGAQTDWFVMYHDGGFASIGVTGGDKGAGTVNVAGLYINGTAVGGTGTVTSVAMTMPGVLFNSTVPGSPITTTGTLAPTLLAQTANTVFGNFTGSSATPTFNAVPSCSAASQALNYTAGTGLGCVTISAGSVTFSAITGSTNTTAAMIVGTGASITFSGSGTINASSLQTFVTGTSGGTIPLLNGINTYSGVSIFSGAGAASTASVAFTGTLFTGGSTTTTFPLLYVNLGTAPTTFSTSGTLLGFNAPSGFTGNFLDLHLNGGVSIINIASTGKFTLNQQTTTNTDAFNLNNSAVNRIFSIGYDAGQTLQVTWGATRAATFTGLATFANAATFTTSVTSAVYNTATNCANTAAPAVCGSAAAGAVVIAIGATTVTVNSTAVTANSEIEITPDTSLSTRLGVTCNTTLASIIGPVVTARTAGTSFQISITGTLVGNPACYTYSITN